MEIANVVVAATNKDRPAAVFARVGADVVLTVREAPPEGGRGVVSLAGLILQVRLPAGLLAGQTLAARVVEATPEQLVFRLHAGETEAALPTSQAHAAGALAVAGQPELLRAAVALAPPGLALPLPNGDALSLAVGDEHEQGDEPAADGEAQAGFVLHSAALGPIEVRIRTGPGGITAGVVVDSPTLQHAISAAPELARMLELATGEAATVGVTARTAGRPPAPRVAEGLDAYA